MPDSNNNWANFRVARFELGQLSIEVLEGLAAGEGEDEQGGVGRLVANLVKSFRLNGRSWVRIPAPTQFFRIHYIRELL